MRDFWLRNRKCNRSLIRNEEQTVHNTTQLYISNETERTRLLSTTIMMYDGLDIVITTVRVSRSQFYIIYPNHQHPHPRQHQHQYQYQSNQYRHQYIHYLLYAHVHYYLGNVQKKKQEIEQKIQ